jgi:cytoskeletal protein CcmA (bactofilin family)
MDELNKTPADDANKDGSSLESTGNNDQTTAIAADDKQKKIAAPHGGGPIGVIMRHVNIYLVLFIFVVAVAGVITAVAYLNSQRKPAAPTISSQTLTQEALNQLANTDAKVGDAKSVLTVQSNAVFAGQVVVGGDLSVAGALRVGKPLEVTGITVSGASTLGQTQIRSLAVAEDTNIDGRLVLKGNLTVAGSANFAGTMTANVLNVSRLVLDSSGSLQINNHILAGGPPPQLGFGSALGSGGTASVNGSDTAGSITINTGGGPAAGCFATVTFARTFSSTPRVVITPVGAAAAGLDYYVNRSTTSFSVCSTSAAPGGQSFGFDYIIFD